MGLKKILIFITILGCFNMVQSQTCVRGTVEGEHGSEEVIYQLDSCRTEDCRECPDNQLVIQDGNGHFFCVTIIRPIDPNDIVGPAGVGKAQWVAWDERLNYTIRYENDPEFANGAARNVSINHVFHPKANRNSMELGYYGFHAYAFEVPAKRSYYGARHDVSDSLGVHVDVNAGINPGENTAFWRLVSLDPATGLEPNSVELGFLPVNDSTGRGTGFVTFSVLPKATVQTGDTISAQASIIFDDNEAILTNTHFNSIDADLPESELSLEAIGDSVQLTIKGSDIGSGLAYIELFQSIDQGPLTLIDTLYPGDTLRTYAYQPEDTVCFVSFATDSVGNFEGFQKALEACWPDVMVSVEEEPEENEAFNELKAFPNPTSDLMTLQLPEGLGKGELTISNIAGVSLQTIALSGDQNEVEVPLRAYPVGVYLLKLATEEGVFVLRVVKE